MNVHTTMTARTPFLGLAFDPLTLAEVEGWVGERDASSPFAYVVTPNVDHVVRLAEGAVELRAAYDDATLTVCDSRVLSRTATLCGLRLPVATGSDLVAHLFTRVLRPADAVCVVGSTAAHVALLRRRFPHLTIAHHEPPFNLTHDRAARLAAARFAAAAGARVTLLAVGSPRQELIAREMLDLTDAHGTALCVGASIDFLVGAQRRAPVALQHAGLEWAWRLVTDPRRFARRYLVRGPRFVPLLLRWWRDRAR